VTYQAVVLRCLLAHRWFVGSLSAARGESLRHGGGLAYQVCDTLLRPVDTFDTLETALVNTASGGYVLTVDQHDHIVAAWDEDGRSLNPNRLP